MTVSDMAEGWLHAAFGTTWVTIGSTPITLSRMLGLVLILVMVWWLAHAVERVLVRLARAGGAGSLSDSAVYAFSPTSRYQCGYSDRSSASIPSASI